MSTVALRIKNSLAEIARVTETIERMAADQRLPMNAVWPLNVAINEVLSNVIRYAHGMGWSTRSKFSCRSNAAP